MHEIPLSTGFIAVLSLCFLLVLVTSTSSACGVNQYTRIKGSVSQCLDCDPRKCPPGYNLVPSCGSEITNTTQVDCEKCPENTYSDTYSTEDCKPRTECEKEHRVTLKNYTRKSNAECGNCLPGYYEENGFCHCCTFCCNNSTDDIVAQCSNAGPYHCKVSSNLNGKCQAENVDNKGCPIKFKKEKTTKEFKKEKTTKEPESEVVYGGRHSKPSRTEMIAEIIGPVCAVLVVIIIIAGLSVFTITIKRQQRRRNDIEEQTDNNNSKRQQIRMKELQYTEFIRKNAIKDLFSNYSVKEEVGKMLTLEDPGFKNWKHMAEQYPDLDDKTKRDLKICSQKSSCNGTDVGEALLQNLIARYGDENIETFLSKLEKIKRPDIIKVIMNHIMENMKGG